MHRLVSSSENFSIIMERIEREEKNIYEYLNYVAKDLAIGQCRTPLQITPHERLPIPSLGPIKNALKKSLDYNFKT